MIIYILTNNILEIKCQLDATDEFLQILLLAQHVSGTTMPIKAPNTTSSNHLYNTLQLLMMGIVVSETC